MRGLMLLALLAVAGCESYGPTVVVQSATTLTVEASYDRRQPVEDTAVAHCARQGLAPHLVSEEYQTDKLASYRKGGLFRFECVRR